MVRGIGAMRAGLMLALTAGMAIDQRRRVIVIDEPTSWPSDLAPVARDRRAQLVDWPMTDPHQEAARRVREDRERQRKAKIGHPEGPCSYRATGSKRSRRRRRGRA